MRNLFVSMTMTFDGFLAGPSGELEWTPPDPEALDDLIGLIETADTGLIGYPTAVGMVSYWRGVPNNPSASPSELALAEAINENHPAILSRSEEPLPWDDAELLIAASDDDMVRVVTELKSRAGKAIGVPGGVRTAQKLSRLGLVDEFVLMVHPVAIGEGRRLFTARADLELVEAKAYVSGVVRAHYRPRHRR
jgi:dihydrofolate reductase